MKKLPIGIQNFKEIVMGDYIYVDKTQYIYNLINDAKYFFLSRPRRFGKSLLLDTIDAVFSGEKELFKGLWIYNSDYAFKKHPVIRLDMSNIANKTPDILEESLSFYIKMCYNAENFIYEESIASNTFMKLITLLHNKYNERVVVLIDEYDKPILDHIDDIGVASGNRKALRGFYGILKSMDPYLAFTFLTGVTKFTKTSIFSELNNLMDITMAEDYAGICGIPTDGLSGHFGEHISQLRTNSKFTHFDNITDEILRWYDGYSWDGENRVINPYSLLSFFKHKKFEYFWYSSGTPGFLVEILKNKPESFLTLKNLELSERTLDSFEVEEMQIEPLLFQSGYLTVKKRLPTKGASIYLVDAPNLEVREAFNFNILTRFTGQSEANAENAYRKMLAALNDGNLQGVLALLKGLFASIPYNLHVDAEAYYHSIFYAVMNVLGFNTDVEVAASKGRIDAVLELGNKVYVMEFKYAKCAPDTNGDEKMKLFNIVLDGAMKQINDRGYCDRYVGSGKTVYKAAFAFLGRDDIELKAETVNNS